MKVRLLFILLISWLSAQWTLAQISYGGTPLFLENSMLRSTNLSNFIEMPAFDLDSVLRMDKLNEGNMRGSFNFAYKFYTHIRKGIEGENRVLPDGTKVWRVGIRSNDAYSINLLFTKYHLPEGGKLFIYNADQTHVIGAFDHRNNSEARLLPTRPVSGDEIIVEYSEPADAAFEAELEIGEVNHDYRGLLRREPGIADIIDADPNNSNPDERDFAVNYSCMPDVVCENMNEALYRSTVLYIINGNAGCTGTLVNNTENDGKPYLLTAMHCFNTNYPKDQTYYDNLAKTIVAFFNYSRPFCGQDTVIPSEEMSMAILHPAAMVEKKDIALLEFQEKPPVYYNAYYAGWNAESQGGMPPYTNMHHPSAAVKKYGYYNHNISLESAYTQFFDNEGHWKISKWDIGSTKEGSSGSPLFDKDNLIVGTLTSGNSRCLEDPRYTPQRTEDYFAAFFKGWNPNTQAKLKTYLDPLDKGVTKWEGLDPNIAKPIHRIGNAQYNAGDRLALAKYSELPNAGYLFGSNNLNVMEFAEEFQLESSADLYGVYVFLPPMNYSITSGVKVKVYTGTNGPEQKIAEQSFMPKYLKYTGGNFVSTNRTMHKVATENFVRFSMPVKVDQKFFVAYEIPANSNDFAVYNTQVLAAATPNTAWIKDAQGRWTPSNQYTPQPVSTSLAIQALLSYDEGYSVPSLDTNASRSIRYLRDEHRLLLPENSCGTGAIQIYSIHGKLLESIPVIQQQKSVFIRSLSERTVYIVRLVRGQKVYTNKFIY